MTSNVESKNDRLERFDGEFELARIGRRRTYGGSFGLNTPLDDEPVDVDAALEDQRLEAEQAAHEATVEAESDPHTVLRHTEFYPLDPDTRGWTIDEVDAALGLR
jgi:hypothetical protein